MPRFYNWDDEDYCDSEEKFIKNKKSPSKVKKEKKGHQSMHGKRDQIWGVEEDTDIDLREDNYSSLKTPKKPENAPKKAPEKKEVDNSSAVINVGDKKPEKSFTYGPNTHTIKNIPIDFDRVVNIEKIENEVKGKMTYGLKFTFVGKKGSSRVIWYNWNVRERDSVFNSEYSYWISLKK